MVVWGGGVENGPLPTFWPKIDAQRSPTAITHYVCALHLVNGVILASFCERPQSLLLQAVSEITSKLVENILVECKFVETNSSNFILVE